MSFIVRTVARTADGRQIVRPVTVGGTIVTIGRDTANDIHLGDLAVEPFHAVLTDVGHGLLQIGSVNGLGFSVDGRTTTRAEFDASRGAELRFGSHVLRVGNEGGNVVIVVERAGALSDASEDKDEAAFGLKGLLPGKRPSAWGFALLVLVTCLAWPIMSYAQWHQTKVRPSGFHADTMWSSGPLSRAHHGLENDCQACHDKAFVAVEDRKCTSCHTGTHDHADAKLQQMAMASPGLQQRVENMFKIGFGVPTGQRCVDCHTEHEGAGAMPATAQAFCADCHATMSRRLPKTRVVDIGDFGEAHGQFRPLVSIGTAHGKAVVQRVSLDARPVEDNGLKFPHALHLSNSNGVARMAQTMRGEQGWGNTLACKDCHDPTSDGVRFQPVDMERDCQMCHSLAFDKVAGTYRTLRHGQTGQVVADLRAYYRSGGPVRPIVLSGMARRRPGGLPNGTDYRGGGADTAVNAIFTKGGACYDCHVLDRTGDAASAGWHVRKPVQPMRYMAKGWFDHEAHKTESCVSCHGGALTSNSARDVLLPGIGKLGDTGGKTCRSCHAGEAATSAKVPSGCAMCHSYHMDNAAPWRSRDQVATAKGQMRRVGLTRP